MCISPFYDTCDKFRKLNNIAQKKKIKLLLNMRLYKSFAVLKLNSLILKLHGRIFLHF